MGRGIGIGPNSASQSHTAIGEKLNAKQLGCTMERPRPHIFREPELLGRTVLGMPRPSVLVLRSGRFRLQSAGCPRSVLYSSPISSSLAHMVQEDVQKHPTKPPRSDCNGRSAVGAASSKLLLPHRDVVLPRKTPVHHLSLSSEFAKRLLFVLKAVFHQLSLGLWALRPAPVPSFNPSAKHISYPLLLCLCSELSFQPHNLVF